ncbi:MAG: hypothetical protein R3E32_01115 [Chitinophagales bacterium]
MDQEQNLGIYSDIPVSRRIVDWLSRMVDLLFLRPWSMIIGDAVWVLVSIFALTAHFRYFTQNAMSNILLFVILAGFTYIYGNLVTSHIIPRTYQWFFGRAVFGLLGGLDKATFFTLLNTSKLTKFSMKAEDQAIAEEFCEVDNDLTKALFRDRYYEIYKNANVSPEELEESWERVWENQVLPVSSGKVSFEEARKTDNIALRVLPLKFQNMSLLISPFIKFFQLISVCLIATFLANAHSLLFAIQVIVALNILLSLVWYMLHSYQISEVPLLTANLQYFSQSIIDRFGERLNKFAGKVLIPKNITIDRAYFSEIRNYQARHILLYTILNTFFLLCMLGITFFMDIVLGTNIALVWYKQFAIGLLLLPFVFLLGFYFISIIIQNVRRVTASVLVGLTTAVLPFVIYYLVTGNFEVEKVQNGIWASVAGIVGVLSTTIAGQFKEILESE